MYKKLNLKQLNFFYKIAIYVVIFGCFFQDCVADVSRSTSFDERPACESSNGMWREFGNGCADKCEFQYDKYTVCSQALTFGCECGRDKCMYEDKCILNTEYEKINQKIFEEKNKVSDEDKAKRERAAKRFKSQYTNKLAGIFGADPNYRDPYRDQREKRKNPNSFTSTNRQIIYNDIIKKRNDKILSVRKGYEDEIKKLRESGSVPEDQIVSLEKKLDENMKKFKTLEPIKIDDQDSSNDKSQKISKNEPIVLQPVNDMKIDDYNNISDNISNIMDPKKILDYAKNAKNTIDNSLSSDAKPNLNDSDLPTVYVKSQNGEKDFGNKEVIDNKSEFPQFVN